MALCLARTRRRRCGRARSRQSCRCRLASNVADAATWSAARGRTTATALLSDTRANHAKLQLHLYALLCDVCLGVRVDRLMSVNINADLDEARVSEIELDRRLLRSIVRHRAAQCKQALPELSEGARLFDDKLAAAPLLYASPMAAAAAVQEREVTRGVDVMGQLLRMYVVPMSMLSSARLRSARW